MTTIFFVTAVTKSKFWTKIIDYNVLDCIGSNVRSPKRKALIKTLTVNKNILKANPLLEPVTFALHGVK